VIANQKRSYPLNRKKNDLFDQLQSSRQQNQKLNIEKTKLDQTITHLGEKNQTYKDQIEKLENTQTKLTNQLKEKDQELENVKKTLKDNKNGNPKFFRALAEELQTEKTKSLKLNAKLYELTQELNDKKQYIEQFMTSKNYSSSQSNFQKLEEELQLEKLKSQNLMKELENLRSLYEQSTAHTNPSVLH